VKEGETGKEKRIFLLLFPVTTTSSLFSSKKTFLFFSFSALKAFLVIQ